MANNAQLLAVKMPADLARAIEAAEKKTGANRSEVAREAITIGLRPAVNRLLDRAKQTRELLTIAK